MVRRLLWRLPCHATLCPASRFFILYSFLELFGITLPLSPLGCAAPYLELQSDLSFLLPPLFTVVRGFASSEEATE